MPLPALIPGKTAIITGAASGIGLAAARAMAARGMAVALIDLPGDKLTAAAAGIAATGARALALPADVSDPAQLAEAARRIAADLPPVTFLMNNAGIGQPSSTLTGAAAFLVCAGLAPEDFPEGELRHRWIEIQGALTARQPKAAEGRFKATLGALDSDQASREAAMLVDLALRLHELGET